MGLSRWSETPSLAPSYRRGQGGGRWQLRARDITYAPHCAFLTSCHPRLDGATDCTVHRGSGWFDDRLPLTMISLPQPPTMARPTPSPTPTCKVDTCESAVRSLGHMECPIHSPCHSNGWFTPKKCQPCRDIYYELCSAEGDVRRCPSYVHLEGTLYCLTKALDDAPGLPRLQVRQGRVTRWFPQLFPDVELGSRPTSPVHTPDTCPHRARRGQDG